MKINWKVRINNPVWWAQILLSILLPILGYYGMTVQELTSWMRLGDVLLKAISNPFMVATVLVSVWSACNDPTTRGLSDSQKALTYTNPH